METTDQSATLTNRRSFMLKGAAAGAGAYGLGRLLADPSSASAHRKGLSKGDVAILQFLAAAEILETDLWQQYNELAGIQDSEVPGGSGNSAYTAAVAVLDADMAQYIHDNTDDENSHATFLNAYLAAHGADPINLDPFRTLPSSKASGAQDIGRLTNLMQLTVDTSFWTRYRSDSQNPDLGDTLPQAIPDLATGEHPAIPRSDSDLTPPDHLQAIANTAGFHFAFIEQGGTSLYADRLDHPSHGEQRPRPGRRRGPDRRWTVHRTIRCLFRGRQGAGTGGGCSRRQRLTAACETPLRAAAPKLTGARL